MCLLERVEVWDDDTILCSTHSHKDLNNPLRKGGRLSAIHGLEYGAQAMALHGALLAKREEIPFRGAYVAAVHDLRLLAARLDTLPHRLRVEARRLLTVPGGVVYHVIIDSGGRPVVTARVTVMPRPGERI